eukprot:gene22732-27445_t
MSTQHRLWEQHGVPSPSTPRFMHHAAWEDAVFIHYYFNPVEIAGLLPADLEVDTYQGTAWVGLVLLTEAGIGPAYVPKFLKTCLSLTHHAVNVRTYVKRN